MKKLLSVSALIVVIFVAVGFIVVNRFQNLIEPVPSAIPQSVSSQPAVTITRMQQVEDSFDGTIYTNEKYDFSLVKPSQLYLTNLDFINGGPLDETEGAAEANGSLTLDKASGEIIMQETQFSSLDKNEQAFCDEQIKLNPGSNCAQFGTVLTQDVLTRMKQDVLAKKMTSNIILSGDKETTTPTFIDIKGGVGILSTLHDFDANDWTAHFTTFNNNNDMIDMYLAEPTATTPQALMVLPQYTAFKEAMASFSITDVSSSVQSEINLQGSITKGQTLKRDIGNGLVFQLLPNEDGWDISIVPASGSADYNFTLGTPPFHGTNPTQIEGWFFSNASNTSLNEKSINEPLETRDFSFVLNNSDADIVANAIQQLTSGKTMNFSPNVPLGQGQFIIYNLTLGNLIPNNQAWIESMGFSVNLQIPTSTPSKE